MDKFLLSVSIVSAAFLLWWVLSWVDVVTDNTRKNPTHSKYNAFVVLVNVMEGEQ